MLSFALDENGKLKRLREEEWRKKNERKLRNVIEFTLLTENDYDKDKVDMLMRGHDQANPDKEYWVGLLKDNDLILKTEEKVGGSSKI